MISNCNQKCQTKFIFYLHESCCVFSNDQIERSICRTRCNDKVVHLCDVVDDVSADQNVESNFHNLPIHIGRDVHLKEIKCFDFTKRNLYSIFMTSHLGVVPRYHNHD